MLIDGVACAFVALCYCELASSITMAGGGFRFAAVYLGELVAWLIGWSIVLELTVTGAVEARSWAAYMDSALRGAGVSMPHAWRRRTSSFRTASIVVFR